MTQVGNFGNAEFEEAHEFHNIESSILVVSTCPEYHPHLRNMISGAHIVLYSKNAEADRQFFRDVLEFKSVDAGHGWLIFALPPGEAAFHPSEENGTHELYFICDSLKTEMALLRKKGVTCSEIQEARWGSITKMRLPGGGEVGLYQPKHPTVIDLVTD